MKKIASSDFRNQCSKLLDFVQRTRQPIVITKRGKPVAKLVPVITHSDKWFGRLRGKVKIVGDIVSPIDPPEVWESSR